MKTFVYESESITFEGGCVEVVIVVAKNRKAADQVMLSDPSCWVSDQAHLENVYKVEEKPLQAGTVMFRAKVLERLDTHKYTR